MAPFNVLISRLTTLTEYPLHQKGVSNTKELETVLLGTTITYRLHHNKSQLIKTLQTLPGSTHAPQNDKFQNETRMIVHLAMKKTLIPAHTENNTDRKGMGTEH